MHNISDKKKNIMKSRVWGNQREIKILATSEVFPESIFFFLFIILKFDVKNTVQNKTYPKTVLFFF